MIYRSSGEQQSHHVINFNGDPTSDHAAPPLASEATAKRYLHHGVPKEVSVGDRSRLLRAYDRSWERVGEELDIGISRFSPRIIIEDFISLAQHPLYGEFAIFAARGLSSKTTGNKWDKAIFGEGVFDSKYVTFGDQEVINGLAKWLPDEEGDREFTANRAFTYTSMLVIKRAEGQDLSVADAMAKVSAVFPEI